MSYDSFDLFNLGSFRPSGTGKYACEMRVQIALKRKMTTSRKKDTLTRISPKLKISPNKIGFFSPEK
jgi:hypothetical protein